MNLLPSLVSPMDIHQCIQYCGVRYTFWRLTECDNCSVGRAIYLILLSI
jgi:hypothetical protein